VCVLEWSVYLGDKILHLWFLQAAGNLEVILAAMPPILNFNNTNSLWGSFLAETLFQAGVRRAVVCPGSRSAPLAFAFAQHPEIEATPVLDERSAAFFALGLAQKTAFPVALICTSGTAAANFYPAVIEARESCVPLLVLTADRPPEMRDCASGQTIDQLKIFGHYPRWQAELAMPEPDLKLLAYLRQTLRYACERSLGPVGGPVHLNVPFRDPLAPVWDGSTDGLDREAVEQLLRAIPHSFGARLGSSDEGISLLADHLNQSQRILVVAGPAAGRGEDYRREVNAFSQRWQVPVLADVLSPVRHGAGGNDSVLASYERLLASGELPEELPDLVLRLGPLPTSKRLRNWLDSLDCEHLVIEDGGRNVDPLHSRCTHLRGRVETVLPMLKPADDRSGSWRDAWVTLGTAASAFLDRELAATSNMFEGKIPWLLSRQLPAGSAVFISNSMPVRDAEFFWPAGGETVGIFFNRGANGIDGILSTAMGVAAESNETFLVTGELAFLHDANGLLLSRRIKGRLTVLLINNGGGGIFQMLPISQFEPPFTDFFLTPQQVDFQKLCEAHRVSWQLVETWEAFARAIEDEAPDGVRVIEIRTDSAHDRDTRRRLLSQRSS